MFNLNPNHLHLPNHHQYHTFTNYSAGPDMFVVISGTEKHVTRTDCCDNPTMSDDYNLTCCFHVPWSWSCHNITL